MIRRWCERIRNRDFTPLEDARVEAMGKQANPDWEPLLPEGERMGRADDFRGLRMVYRR